MSVPGLCHSISARWSSTALMSARLLQTEIDHSLKPTWPAKRPLEAHRDRTDSKVSRANQVAAQENRLGSTRGTMVGPRADDVRHATRKPAPPSRLALPQLSQGELVALLLSEQMMRQFRGTPFEADLRQAIAELGDALPKGVSVPLDWIADFLSVRPPTPGA